MMSSTNMMEFIVYIADSVPPESRQEQTDAGM